MTGSPRIITSNPTPRARPAGDFAWQLLGGLGLILTLVGLADWAIAWLPTRFGSAEWEFGTIVATFAGLPLISMGFAALLGSAVARGIRWQIRVVAVAMLLFAVFLLGAAVLFALDVPVALGAVTGPARLGIYKAIAKTSVVGILFIVAYFAAAVAALRHLRTGRRGADIG